MGNWVPVTATGVTTTSLENLARPVYEGISKDVKPLKKASVPALLFDQAAKKPPKGLSKASGAYSTWIFVACGPLGPFAVTKLTR